jgi:hypothetical protein
MTPENAIAEQMSKLRSAAGIALGSHEGELLLAAVQMEVVRQLVDLNEHFQRIQYKLDDFFQLLRNR